MSSNIQIEKTCDHCQKLYTARTLHTRYCSHTCNRKACKANKRAEKLQGYFNSQENIGKEENISARSDLRHVEYLNINEVCTLLNISYGTIFRWIKEGVFLLPTNTGRSTSSTEKTSKKYSDMVAKAIRQNQVVKLRQRKLKSSEVRLFLDAYYKGKRYYETLPEFTLVNAKTTIEKNNNKELLMKAEMIRSKRQLDFVNGEYRLVPDFKKKMLFVDYFKQQMEKCRNEESNYSNWKSTLKHLEAYIGKKPVTLNQVNEQFLEDWLAFMKRAKMKNGKVLATNSIFSYYRKLAACLKKAHKGKLITYNSAENIKGAKPE